MTLVAYDFDPDLYDWRSLHDKSWRAVVEPACKTYACDYSSKSIYLEADELDYWLEIRLLVCYYSSSLIISSARPLV